MIAFYYAVRDANGILCVEQLDVDNGPWTYDKVGEMAASFPETIYFAAGRYFCRTYQCGSCEGCRVADKVTDLPRFVVEGPMRSGQWRIVDTEEYRVAAEHKDEGRIRSAAAILNGGGVLRSLGLQ